MSQPVIGVICKCERPSPEPRSPNFYNPKNDLFPYAQDTLINAIFSAGGIPILVPMPRNLTAYAFDDDTDASAAVLRVMRQSLGLYQGLILQDGNDIFSYEQAVAREAYEQDIPLLGIGTAMSLMAKVIDFQAKALRYCDSHRISRANEMRPGVRVSIVPGTRLHQAIGSESLIVHHMGLPSSVHSTSPNLVVSAYQTIGEPEAIESASRKFYVGVRFRPDFLYSDQDSAGRLIDYFLSIL